MRIIHKMRTIINSIEKPECVFSAFSQQLLQSCCNTNRYRRSFLPTAITFYNESFKRPKSWQRLQQWFSFLGIYIVFLNWIVNRVTLQESSSCTFSSVWANKKGEKKIKRQVVVFVSLINLQLKITSDIIIIIIKSLQGQDAKIS